MADQISGFIFGFMVGLQVGVGVTLVFTMLLWDSLGPGSSAE